MTDRLKEFLKKASENEKLAEELRALQKDTDENVAVDKIIKLAESTGILLTEEDFNAEYGEIDEAELADVTGGWKTCFCVQGGGGTGDKDGKTCACVAVGLGYRKDNDHVRCECIVDGYGRNSDIDPSFE